MESFVVHVDGTYCLKPISADAPHIHAEPDACNENRKAWCAGRLDEKAIAALEALLKKAAWDDYAVGNVETRHHKRLGTAQYFLSVMGSRTELAIARDPTKFYPVVETFQAQFGKPYNLSDKSYVLVNTLLGIRKRTAATRACFQRWLGYRTDAV